MEFVSAHWHEIGSFVAGLVTGTAGSFITIKITNRNRVERDATLVDQSRASAGGDMVGRDKKTSGK
jgi:hypothetical protein